MTFDDPKLLQEFVIESQEHLADVECHLLTLESQQDGVDTAVVNKVFRAVHSIKGAAGFLGLDTLEALAHREEEVLDGLRTKEVQPTRCVISTLLRSTDCLKQLLDAIEHSNEVDVTEHLTALEAILRGEEPPCVSQEHGHEVRPLVKNDAPSMPANTSSMPSKEAVLPASQAIQTPTPLATGTLPQIAGVSAEALREFLIESHDNLEQLERDIVSLERDPCNDALLHSIFRNIHTIKGTAGFLAFSQVERLTHAAENLLGCLRAGTLTMDKAISTALFAAVDTVRKYLTEIESKGNEGDIRCEALIEQLQQAQTGTAVARPPIAASIQSSTSKTIAPKPTANPPAAITSTNPPTLTPPVATQMAESSRAHPPQDNPHSTAADSTIRVDVALLDKLMTRVGELVLARNQILQFTNALGDSELLSTSQRLNLITTELQEGVMKTRMQPIGNVWSKFPRLVRDLATTCGKEVRIEMEGKNTELDKTIIEAIKDPLTHLVRNTVDHGIESPEVRVARGKTMEGCLYLRAFHEGGQVNIEISDDGAGLNLERIKEKAIEKGLIAAEQAARMQDREVCQLIFLPGFSTADKISNVSGRGVGMDVVKTNIEKIGGTVDLQSRSGQGTTIKIKIPLTLAIIPALVVTNDGNRFAIPQVNLLELVRLEGEQAQNNIEWIQGAPVYRLRGRLLPLVYLRQVLKTNAKTTTVSDAINIVVLRADDRQFGLVVDRINDTEEIVVKPLSKQLKGVSVYSGATIMGDGKVALILDVIGLAHSAHVISKEKDRAMGENGSRNREGLCSTQTLLILGTGESQRLALPISQVARLEKISVRQVETADHQHVVQYRGEIMPLIYLAEFFQLERAPLGEDELLNVVVYTEQGQSYGLVIDRILDIVETNLEILRPSARKGLQGSAVIQEHVTDLVDLPAVVREYQPNQQPILSN